MEDVVCIKASPLFFPPSPCPFSCICFIPIGFCSPLQTGHPFTQLINDCFNNITAPSFSCMNGPSGMSLVSKAGRDFYFHPLKGHRKYREKDPSCLAPIPGKHLLLRSSLQTQTVRGKALPTRPGHCFSFSTFIQSAELFIYHKDGN